MHWFWRAAIALSSLFIGCVFGFAFYLCSSDFYLLSIPLTGAVCLFLQATVTRAIDLPVVKRIRIRGPMLACLLSITAWVASVRLSVDYYGDKMSFACRSGILGIYWGDAPDVRNGWLHNHFISPWDGHGAGNDPPEESRWQCYVVTFDELREAWTSGELRQYLGFWWPMLRHDRPNGNIGIQSLVFPFWMPLFVSVSLLALRLIRVTPRPGVESCVRCAYSLTGNTSGVCPECGTGITPPASAPPPSVQ